MQGGDSKKQLSPGMHMLAASEAGIMTLVLTNPIWVVKTRQEAPYISNCLAFIVLYLPLYPQLCLKLFVIHCRLCLQYGVTNPPPNTTIYKGFIDALIKIRRDEGFKGLYKGFVPGIWGVSHGAIQFMAYEELKNAYNINYKNQPVDTKLVSLIIY